MRTVLALACALVSILRPVTAIAAPPAPPPPIIWYQNEGGSCTVTCASLNTTCADETNNNDNPPFDEWPKTVWPTTEAQMEAISDEFDLGCTTYEQKTNIYAVVDPAAEDGSVRCVYGRVDASCPKAYENWRRLCPCLAPPPPPSAPPAPPPPSTFPPACTHTVRTGASIKGFVVGTVVYGSGGVCECVAACKNHSECVAIVHNREQDPPYCKLKSVADTYERGDKDVLFPSLAPPAAQANGDPHLMLAHGGKADFRGTDKGIYNFLSAKNLSLNVMTEFADFYLHDTDHPRHKLVHGSFLTQAHVVAMTGGGRTVHASFWASKIGSLNIGWINATINNQQAFALGPHTTKVVDDVTLHMDYSSLHVTTGEWELAVTPQAVERSVAGPVRRIDVQMTPRVAESRLSVPPHGVIGQSWDGDNRAVFGKEDEFPVRGEYTTSAMAEGAIEGVTTDYLMSSPYATDFKYSRFGLAHASPRDVSGLTGRVKAAAPLASGGAGVMEKEMESSAGQVY